MNVFDNSALPLIRGWTVAHNREGLWARSHVGNILVTRKGVTLSDWYALHMHLVQDYPFVPYSLNDLKLMYFTDLLFHNYVHAVCKSRDLPVTSVLGGIMAVDDDIGRYFELSYLQRCYSELIAQEKLRNDIR